MNYRFCLTKSSKLWVNIQILGQRNGNNFYDKAFDEQQRILIFGIFDKQYFICKNSNGDC